MKRSTSAVLVLLALLLPACGAAPAATPEPSILWIGVTATSVEPRPRISTGIADRLRRAAEAGAGGVVVALADTRGPRQLSATDLALLRGREPENDPGRRAELAEAKIAEVAAAVSGAAGESGELDTLGLLEAVARLDGPLTAVLVSSGMQSSGPLAIGAVGWDRLGSASLLDEAQDRGLLPDLAGVTVVFSGLGDTAGGQDELPEPLRLRLVEHWLGLCERAGATVCVADDEPVPAEASTSVVPVVPVAVPVQDPLPFTVTVPVVVALPADITFRPDDAALLPGAHSMLVEFARAAGEVTVDLVGHTASVPPAAGARALSLRRATAVRDALVAGGLDGDHITVAGVGYDEPLVADRDGAGALIPDAAQRNRVVVMTVTATGGLA